MKIIQHGRIKTNFSTVKRFKCGSCDCVFDGVKGEYRAVCLRNDLLYRCKCPECGKRANEIIMRGCVTL